jgi:hypothetical protein
MKNPTPKTNAVPLNIHTELLQDVWSQKLFKYMEISRNRLSTADRLVGNKPC